MGGWKDMSLGMRKDFILTPEGRQLKQRRLEENRRHTTETSISPKIEVGPVEMTQFFSKGSSLTALDWSCLHSMSNAYLSACQSSPSASSMVSLELGPDRISTFMNTLDVQNYAAMKLINFLRNIPEFVELDEGDRLILVKYNLTLLFVPRFSLAFDAERELAYDEDHLKQPFTPEEEAFAQHRKSLCVVCYGYDFNRSFMSILRTLTELVDGDPIIAQLLMLTMIFLKGLSGNYDQEPSLKDARRVFHAQSRYTDLLFRYLLDQSPSFDRAVMKMMHLIEVLIKIQRILHEFRQKLTTKIDSNYINPLMKSLLNMN